MPSNDFVDMTREAVEEVSDLIREVISDMSGKKPEQDELRAAFDPNDVPGFAAQYGEEEAVKQGLLYLERLRRKEV